LLGPDHAVDETIGQSSDSRLEAAKRLTQLPKTASSSPDQRRQSWLVCDEASGESSNAQPRAKRRCRTAGVSRFSPDLVGHTSGLAIERIESVHLLHLLESNRSCQLADEAERGRRDCARPIDRPRHGPRRPQIRALSARPETIAPQLCPHSLAAGSIARRVHRNDDPITGPRLFRLLGQRGCHPFGHSLTLCRQPIPL
jgi:hypothetical protein